MSMSNIKFTKKNSLPVIELVNSTGKLEVSTFGASVLSWVPSGGKDVLWMSPYSQWKQGVPLRGGIPVCFPWFGPNAKHPDWQLHGFVRTRIWNIEEIVADKDSTKLVLSLDGSTIEERFGYGTFKLRLAFTLAKSLSIEFTVENTSDKDFTFENGLHTYFAGCPQDALFTTFDGISYYDKTQGFSKNTRHGDFRFSSDREQAHFYVDARKHNTIDIKGKTISIDHDGFESAILWSPGEAAGLANSEIRDGWKDFFCLESANARDNIVTIKPGAKHTSVLTISLK